MNNLNLIPTSQEISWPSKNEFLQVLSSLYDWDVLLLNESTLNVLPYPVNICEGGFPCVLTVVGKQNAFLEKYSNGEFVCASESGCEGILIDSVHVHCSETTTNSSLISVTGADVNITNSTFLGCSAEVDGTVIQAFDTASIVVKGSLFANLASSGFGGALSAVGASLIISGTTFINCSSANGGALSVVDYQCTRSSSIPASVQIFESVFENCHSQQFGGALFSQAGTTIVENSTFVSCYAQVSGGSIFAGGISGNEVLTLLSPYFDSNKAGESGGAMYIQNVKSSVINLWSRENKALNGGGGVILWDGYKTGVFCGPGSFAWNETKEFECELCWPGTYQSATGMTSSSACLTCGSGTFSVQGASVCTLCPAGTFSPLTVSTSPANCKLCELGKYQPQLGSAAGGSCLKCPFGMFSSARGQSFCNLCGAGTTTAFQASNSSDLCAIACGPGSYLSSGTSVCLQCSTGTFSTGGLCK